MTQAAAARYAAADAALNAQWKLTRAFMKSLDAEDTSRGGGFGYWGTLLEGQRAWLLYRDLECSLGERALCRRIDAADGAGPM